MGEKFFICIDSFLCGEKDNFIVSFVWGKDIIVRGKLLYKNDIFVCCVIN